MNHRDPENFIAHWLGRRNFTSQKTRSSLFNHPDRHQIMTDIYNHRSTSTISINNDRIDDPRAYVLNRLEDEISTFNLSPADQHAFIEFCSVNIIPKIFEDYETWTENRFNGCLDGWIDLIYGPPARTTLVVWADEFASIGSVFAHIRVDGHVGMRKRFFSVYSIVNVNITINFVSEDYILEHMGSNFDLIPDPRDY